MRLLGILPPPFQEHKDIIHPLLMLERKAIMNKWVGDGPPLYREWLFMIKDLISLEKLRFHLMGKLMSFNRMWEEPLRSLGVSEDPSMVPIIWKNIYKSTYPYYLVIKIWWYKLDMVVFVFSTLWAMVNILHVFPLFFLLICFCYFLLLLLLNCNNISQYYCFNCFWSNNCSLGDSFQKH